MGSGCSVTQNSDRFDHNSLEYGNTQCWVSRRGSRALVPGLFYCLCGNSKTHSNTHSLASTERRLDGVNPPVYINVAHSIPHTQQSSPLPPPQSSASESRTLSNFRAAGLRVSYNASPRYGRPQLASISVPSPSARIPPPTQTSPVSVCPSTIHSASKLEHPSWMGGPAYLVMSNDAPWDLFWVRWAPSIRINPPGMLAASSAKPLGTPWLHMQYT